MSDTRSVDNPVLSDHLLPDGSIPLLVSSNSAALVATEASAVREYVRTHAGVGPGEVASMMLRTRVPRRHRALARVRDRAQMLDALDAIAAGEPHTLVTSTSTSAPAGAHRLAYVFPGQGSQRPGMGRMFYAASAPYRDMVDRCDAMWNSLFGYSPLWYLLSEDGGAADRSDDGLSVPLRADDIRVIQPALLMHMLGLAAMWRDVGIRPAATVGHSQGELAATYFSDLISLQDAIWVVTTRAQMVKENVPRGYSMAVLGIDRDECEDLLARERRWVELSVINSSHIVCVSGDAAAVEDMVRQVDAAGKFARQIGVDYPAHTSIVTQFRGVFAQAVRESVEMETFRDSAVPCYGSTLGVAIGPEIRLDDYWFWNLRNRVRFDRAMQAAVAGGVDTFVEMAEHPTLLLAMGETLSETDRGRACRVIPTSRRSADDLAEFTRNVAAVAVGDVHYDWTALRRPESPIRLPLREFPAVVMKKDSYWAGYRSAQRANEPAPATPGPAGPEPTTAGSIGPGPVTAPRDVTIPDTHCAPRRLDEAWVKLDRRAMIAPRSILVIDHTERCAPLAEALVSAAERHGAYARVATRSSGTSQSPGLDTAVILLPESSCDDPVAAARAVSEFFADHAWLTSVREVGDTAAKPIECWLVTVGGEAAEVGDRPDPVAAGIAAGYRCIGAERSGISTRHVDLPTGSGVDVARSVVTAIHTADEPELALRGGSLYAKRLVPVDPEPVHAESIDVGPVADYSVDTLTSVVITGGTGKLGLEFCEHFARRGAGRITLLSRSGETRETSERIRRVRATSTTEIVVRRCDVTDESAVERVADDMRKRPASLVIHAALSYDEAELAGVTPETIAAAVGAKITGLTNVLRILPTVHDVHVLLCSSLAATLGGRGQIVYAATNRMLDALAHRLRGNGIRCCSVQWGLWDVVGVLDDDGRARVRATGVRPMLPADAIDVGLTRHVPATAATVVAAADWTVVRSVVGSLGYRPLLSRIPDHPGVDTPTTHAQPTTNTPPVDEPSTSTPPTDARELDDIIRGELMVVMGARDGDDLDTSAPLVALGLDSLQALDFRTRVQNRVQRELPVEAILGGASLDEVVAQMRGGTP